MIPGHPIQKRFRSHGNELPKQSKSEERDNSSGEGDVSIRFDQNLLQGENQLTDDRIQQKTEDKQKSEEVRSEVFISCGVVTVTF
jgi:hypothetical protein